MGYVENLYGVVDQQLNNALIPSARNMYDGNLIQPLTGGTRGRKRGGNLASAIPALSLLAAQQLYRRKSHRSHKFRRSRRIRSRRIR